MDSQDERDALMPEGWKRHFNNYMNALRMNLKTVTLSIDDYNQMLHDTREMAEALELSNGPVTHVYSDEECAEIGAKIDAVLKKFMEWK